MSALDLTRTEAALGALDVIEAEPTPDDVDDTWSDAWVARRDAARAALGEAFAADTADRNEAEVARGVSRYPAGITWIRSLVAAERAAQIGGAA